MRHGRYEEAPPGRLPGEGRPRGRPADQDRRRARPGVQVYPVQINKWKKHLLDHIDSLFCDGRRREREEGQARQAELYE